MGTAAHPPPAETPPADPARQASPRATPEGAMETDPDPPVEAPPAKPQEGLPPGAGPMEVDSTAVGRPCDPPSQPGTPRSQLRTPASAHPYGIWFCAMPRCPRREGASPTGWGWLQSLVSHLRSVHLSAGSAPPDSWLQAHNLRVCLACHVLSAVGSRFPGPRCSSAVLAALAAGNSAPGANTFSTVRAASPGPEYPPNAGHAGPHAAQGTHCVLLQLRPGPDVPAEGCGTRADVGGPGPPSPLPPHRAGRPGPRREGQTILLYLKMPPEPPVVGP